MKYTNYIKLELVKWPIRKFTPATHVGEMLNLPKALGLAHFSASAVSQVSCSLVVYVWQETDLNMICEFDHADARIWHELFPNP